MRRECRERFPPPPISKETDSWRSRHASRHVRDALAVMHVGIAHLRWRGKRSRHSRRMRTRNFTYLARGPWQLTSRYSKTHPTEISMYSRKNSWHENVVFKMVPESDLTWYNNTGVLCTPFHRFIHRISDGEDVRRSFVNFPSSVWIHMFFVIDVHRPVGVHRH